MHSSHNITPQSMIFLNLLAHYSFDIAFISCSLIIASKSLTHKSHSNKINFLVIAVTVWYVVALWRVVTFSFVFRVIIRSSCLFLCVDLFLSGWLDGWLADGSVPVPVPVLVVVCCFLNLSNQNQCRSKCLSLLSGFFCIVSIFPDRSFLKWFRINGLWLSERVCDFSIAFCCLSRCRSVSCCL